MTTLITGLPAAVAVGSDSEAAAIGFTIACSAATLALIIAFALWRRR